MSTSSGQPLTIACNPDIGEGVSLVVPFDNTLSLWRDRALIAKASPLVLVGADANRFVARTLTDVLRLVPPGRVVCLLSAPTASLSTDALMGVIESLAPGEFQRLPSDAAGPDGGAVMIVRSAPALPWWTAPHSGWSVALVDGDSPALSSQLANTEDAARRAGVACEILVASSRNPRVNSERVRVIHLPDANASLAMRLNLLAHAATRSELLYLRSGHVPTPEFFSAMNGWGYAYAIATPRIVHADGTRGADWLLLAANAPEHAPVAQLDYRAHSPCATIGGGAMLLRLAAWQRHRWNENLRGEQVVLEYVRRLQRAGSLPMVADAVIRADTPVPSLPLMPCDSTRDVALAPHDGPWCVTWLSSHEPWLASAG